jgi:hypothetical protein
MFFSDAALRVLRTPSEGQSLYELFGAHVKLCRGTRPWRKKTVVDGRNYCIIIGAMKSGTTSLKHHLNAHPEIAPCRIGEPAFFVDPRLYRNGFSWYEGLWDFDPSVHRIALENTGNNTKHPQFPCPAARIARHIPDCRLIYIVRNPIERIDSHFNYNLRQGWVRFGEHIADEKFISPSRYAYQLGQYEQYFPKEAFLVETLENFSARPQEVLRRVHRFLGITPMDFEGAGRVHNKACPTTRLDVLVSRGHLIYVKNWTPWPIKKALKALLPKSAYEAVPRTELSEAEKRLIWERLEEDQQRLEEHWGFRYHANPVSAASC